MSIRIAVLCGALAAMLASDNAHAAVWTWGCMGPFEDKQVIFSRNSLVIVPGAASRGKLADMIHRDILLKDGEQGDSYDALDGNSGFEPKIEFTKNAESGQTLTLIEKSSRVVKAQKGRAGPRDEFTTTFRKVYSLARIGKPVRDIKMECMEYMLSTKGGRR